MKKYIKPDAEIIKFDIADVMTNSDIFNPFAQNAVDEQVYVEGDEFAMTPGSAE